MKIKTVYFDTDKKYGDLIKVFKNSANFYMPDIDVDIYEMKPPKDKNREGIYNRRVDMANAFIFLAKKTLEEQNEIIAACDADLMFTNSIEDIKEYNFDVAITIREGKYIFNTGIGFFDPNDRSRHFINTGIDETKRLMNNYYKYEDLINKFAGTDQASLYTTLEKTEGDVNILKLPCWIGNSTQNEGKYFDKDNTKVVHIKSDLRKRYCLVGKIPKNKTMKKIVTQGNNFLHNN